MLRLVGALRSAIVPARGTPQQRDPVAEFVATTLRVRRPRGAAQLGRFVDDARRALRGNVRPLRAVGCERALESYLNEPKS